MTEGSSSQTTPVLVLGAGFTALSVLRAFGRKGIPAYVMIDKGDDCAIRFSRWFKSIPLSRTKFLTLPAFLDAGVLERAVVIPCSDLWVEAASLLPRRLTQRFPSTVASNPAVFLDKGLLAQTLTKLGLPHPETILLRTEKDFGDLPETAFVHFFLKPRRSFNFSKRFGCKAMTICSRDEAIGRFNQIVEHGFLPVLQEFIPGPPTAHYLIDGFIDRTGIVRAMFASRRMRMYPEKFGDSTYQVSIPINRVD